VAYNQQNNTSQKYTMKQKKRKENWQTEKQDREQQKALAMK